MSWKITANDTVPIGTFEILKAGIVLPPAAEYFAGTMAPSAYASLSSSMGTMPGPRPPPRPPPCPPGAPAGGAPCGACAASVALSATATATASVELKSLLRILRTLLRVKVEPLILYSPRPPPAERAAAQGDAMRNRMTSLLAFALLAAACAVAQSAQSTNDPFPQAINATQDIVRVN